MWDKKVENIQIMLKLARFQLCGICEVIIASLISFKSSQSSTILDTQVELFMIKMIADQGSVVVIFSEDFNYI